MFWNTIILHYPQHPVRILSQTTPNQLLPGAFTPLVKQSEPADDHSAPSRLWVKNAWSYTSILSCLHLISRYKFTFNIIIISPIFSSSCFLVATHSSPRMFSRKIKSSFGTESDVELNVNFNKNIRL